MQMISKVFCSPFMLKGAHMFMNQNFMSFSKVMEIMHA